MKPTPTMRTSNKPSSQLRLRSVVFLLFSITFAACESGRSNLRKPVIQAGATVYIVQESRTAIQADRDTTVELEDGTQIVVPTGAISNNNSEVIIRRLAAPYGSADEKLMVLAEGEHFLEVSIVDGSTNLPISRSSLAKPLQFKTRILGNLSDPTPTVFLATPRDDIDFDQVEPSTMFEGGTFYMIPPSSIVLTQFDNTPLSLLSTEIYDPFSLIAIEMRGSASLPSGFVTYQPRQWDHEPTDSGNGDATSDADGTASETTTGSGSGTGTADTGSGTGTADTGSGTGTADTGSGSGTADTGSGTGTADTGSGSGTGETSINCADTEIRTNQSNNSAYLWWQHQEVSEFLIVRSTWNAPTWEPQSGESYSVGAVDGDHDIVHLGPGSTLLQTALVNGNSYYYALYCIENTDFIYGKTVHITPDGGMWEHYPAGGQNLQMSFLSNGCTSDINNLGDAIVACQSWNSAQSMIRMLVYELHDGVWSAPTDAEDSFIAPISTGVNNDLYSIKVRLNDRGQAVIAWQQKNASGHPNVFAATRSPDLTWAKPANNNDHLSTNASTAHTFLQMDQGIDGYISLIWRENSGGDPSILRRDFDPDSGWEASASKMSPEGGTFRDPHIAVRNREDALISYAGSGFRSHFMHQLSNGGWSTYQDIGFDIEDDYSGTHLNYYSLSKAAISENGQAVVVRLQRVYDNDNCCYGKNYYFAHSRDIDGTWTHPASKATAVFSHSADGTGEDFSGASLSVAINNSGEVVVASRTEVGGSSEYSHIITRDNTYTWSFNGAIHSDVFGDCNMGWAGNGVFVSLSDSSEAILNCSMTNFNGDYFSRLQSSVLGSAWQSAAQNELSALLSEFYSPDHSANRLGQVLFIWEKASIWK